MLRSPIDIPCRTCSAPAGAKCTYVHHHSTLHRPLVGYHHTRTYVDFPAAKAALAALFDQ